MYTDNDILEAVIDSQHCQRNWELSRAVSKDDLNLFIAVLNQSPMKQNINIFNINVVIDRVKIEQIYKSSIVTSKEISNFNLQPNNFKLNPQTYANILFILDFNNDIFYEKEYNDRNYQIKLIQDSMSNDAPIGHKVNREITKEFEKQFACSSSMALGQLSLIANLRKYKTGFCGCFDTDNLQRILNTKTTTFSPILGVGFPDDNKFRNIDHFSDYNYTLFSRLPVNINII